MMPYSGPASAYGTIGKLQAAYFAKVNKNGGINGRTVKLISLDDSYSPPKAVEQVRKLVEQEHVVAVFNAVGTPSNSAIQKYLNDKHVAAAVRLERRHQVGRPDALPVHHRLQPQLPPRGQDVRPGPAEEEPQGQGRGPLPERRLRQGRARRLQGRHGRQGQADRRRGELRGHRPHHRLADGDAQGQQGRRLPQHRHAQVCRAGHPQGSRPEVEGHAVPGQRQSLRWAACSRRQVSTSPRGSSRSST